MIINEESYIEHFGTLHKSGRYPWNSGKDPMQNNNKSFLDYVDEMSKQGLTDTEIAKGVGITRTELQTRKSVAKNEQKQADIIRVQSLKNERGMSNMAIARDMGINESSVRALLAPGQMAKTERLMETSNMLKEHVDSKGLVDVGIGVEHHLGLSRGKLDKALIVLQLQGYAVEKVQVDQLGTTNKTTYKVLAPPGTTYTDIKKNLDKIQTLTKSTDDGGLSWSGIVPPISVASSRIKIKYKEDGGEQADGVVYVRPGVKDLSLGNARYAQVRIAVDGTHYIKGMAIYKDDLPRGTDLVFNTVKSNTGNKVDVMKLMKLDKNGKVDQENPFGAVVRQLKAFAPDGTEHATSAMNLVNDEGQWEKWSKNLSSQFLSKQNPTLAKEQLNMTYEKKKLDLDEISALTNPIVRIRLLKSFSDSADSSAVHLKAAALPRQRTQVILPIKSLKETEVYAPNFLPGERVVLIRFPHGGTFEIPELTVNNRNPEASKLIGNLAKDAIGINAKVAERLSGADFDGDTVLVIPNGRGQVKTSPALSELKNFNHREMYKEYPGMIPMSLHAKGKHMGDISNLITDMTIQGAPNSEIARAVKHSMVVIDAEKHNLNYRQSAKDNNIAQLKTKYQGRANAGASTLISLARSRADPLEYRPQAAKDGGPIDKATGKLVFVPTNRSYKETKFRVDPSTGQKVRYETGKTIFYTQKSKKLVETDDAHTLLSKDGGTKIEKVYADHSNKLKALANTARKEMVNTKVNPISNSAKTVYANEVASLSSKLILAQRNAPLERHAQVIANANYNAIKASNKDMENSELKKIKYLALETARNRVGANKKHVQVDITPNEWQAIQAGAISSDKLGKILDNTDLKKVQELATPRTPILMTSAKKARAASMAARGFTQAEIASQLGVSLTTLKTTTE